MISHEFHQPREKNECRIRYPSRAKISEPIPPPLDVDDPTEFLDAIEEKITLLDGILVLLILAVGTIRFHDSIDFVDFRVQSTRGDESG